MYFSFQCGTLLWRRSCPTSLKERKYFGMRRDGLYIQLMSMVTHLKVFCLVNRHSSAYYSGSFIHFIDITVYVSRLICMLIPDRLSTSVPRHNLTCTWPCGPPISHATAGHINKQLLSASYSQETPSGCLENKNIQEDEL